MYTDYKIVTQVKRKKKRMSGLLKITMIVLTVLFVLMGIVFSRGFMLPGFLMALLYLVYDVFSKKDYEYTLENGMLSIDVIYGGRYRRNKHELNLQEMEVLAPNWHDAVAKYRIKGGTVRLPKYDYTSYDDDIPYYTMIIMEKRKKIKLLLDLNDEMMQKIRQLCPGKVFFA
ncbi:UbiA prenyltransferase family protein [Mediterraneibacter glycyrrhizinilyticus]|nr:UbiA family prenyltransferase [Mediterraneibacter glycyrrhizinilyticus]MBM6852940.1 UbiA prenyltransferase family protein [Mediterraneibacter glycyrrhizinilyticus]